MLNVNTLLWKKLCLSLFYVCTKLEYYILPNEMLVLCKFDIVKNLLNQLILRGHLMKWAIKLNVYALTYVPLWAMKGQVLADFITQNPRIPIADVVELANNYVSL